jgi:hypothetical protein
MITRRRSASIMKVHQAQPPNPEAVPLDEPGVKANGSQVFESVSIILERTIDPPTWN